MTNDERDRAIAELRAHLERRSVHNHDRRAARGLAALDALIASERQAKELLKTLVYWHDQGSGHIDESWWDDAREMAKS